MAAPLQYATAQEFDDWAAPSTAYRGITSHEKDVSLQWASRKAAGYVRKRKVLPLISWSEDLKTAVCEIAAYDLMNKRGFPPQSGSDTNYRQRFDDAIAWLTDVSKGLAELDDCVDSSTTPDVDEAGPLGSSDPIVSFNYQTRGGCGCIGGRRG